MGALVKGLAGATGDSDSMKDLVKSLIHGTINGDIIGTEKEEPNESAKTLFKLLTEDTLEKVQKVVCISYCHNSILY